MKINQLFTKMVDIEIVLELLKCFGLKDLHDQKVFSKQDMVQFETLTQLAPLIPVLEEHYLPCKAKIYLRNMSEKKALTVLKQVLRLHKYYLHSQEKNVQNKKVIFYRLLNESDRSSSQHMKQVPQPNLLTFT